MNKLIFFIFNFLICSSIALRQIPYGNNPQAGKYYSLKDDTKLYYELYGQGKPFVLLHGGVYGYIDEFELFIPKLAENYQVICIATRGHGKSEISKDPFTYKQRAEDAYVLKQYLILLLVGFGVYLLSLVKPLNFLLVNNLTSLAVSLLIYSLAYIVYSLQALRMIQGSVFEYCSTQGFYRVKLTIRDSVNPANCLYNETTR